MSEKFLPLPEDEAPVPEAISKVAATGSGGQAETLLGQADEAIVVNRPGQGQTVEIQAVPGATYILNFPASDAQVDLSADGQDLILGFDNNGDGTVESRIVFLDLATDAIAQNPAQLQLGENTVTSTGLLQQLAAYELEEEGGAPPLDDVAAGPGGGGGTSTYSDDFGTTIGLLDGEDVIPGTELQFGLIDLENEILITEEEDGPPLADPVLTPAQQGELPPDLVDALSQLGLTAQVSQLESFLGVPGGTFSGTGGTEGSAIKITFAASAGDAASFDWNFLTNESTPASYNDAAFIVILQDGVPILVQQLADTNSLFGPSSSTFNEETGYTTLGGAVPANGTYTVGLIVFDDEDQSVDSGLLVDNFQINGIVVQGFESGSFVGWETLGDVSVVDGTFQVSPTEGGYQGLLTTAIDGGEGGIGSEIVFFKQLDVSGEIGDDDGGVVADFGGADGETALEDLDFTLESAPTYGQLILVSGGSASLLNPGDTFSSTDTVWWIATQDDIDAFLSGEGAPEFLPDVDFDYSVTDEAGNSAAAPVTITIPREVSPPEVFISLPEEVDCLEEDSTLGDAANQVTVDAAPQGDDLLSEVVITGLQADWTYDFSGLEGPGVTLDTSVAGQVTITFTSPSNDPFVGSFTVQPPADSDVDHPTLTVEATAVEPSDSSLTATGDAILDIHVDANADGGEGSAGDDGDPDHLSVSLSVQDSDGDADSVFETGETGTLTVSATFDDYQDGSETHTVTVTAPTGFSIGGTVGSLPAGVSLLSNDGTTLVLSVETVDGVGSFTADFAVTNESADDGEALFEAEARAVETTTDDVECDPSDADNIAVVTDEANATVANVTPPLVALALPDEIDCLEEDSSLDDAANQVTVSVTPQGDDLLSEIVITGLQADWDYDFDGLDTDGAGTEVTVDTSVAGQVTINFATPTNAPYNGAFSVQPPADSDVDHPTISADATVIDPAEPSLTASGDGSLDIHVDANADGIYGGPGDDGDGDDLSVSVSVADSAGDADDTFETGESGTVTVSATFDDYKDGSEKHTVTLAAPAGFLLGAVVGDLPDGVTIESMTDTEIVLAVDSTDGEGSLGVGSFAATFEVTNESAADGAALFTVEAKAVETSTGDVECDPSEADNVAVVTDEWQATVENAPPEFLIVGENVDDNDPQTVEHAEQFPDEGPNPGEITGEEGADVLIGDFGGGELVGKTLNLVLILDTSDSMEEEIEDFGGATTTRIEALDAAVENLLQQLADTPGLTARIHLISFASDVKAQDTFDIVVDGVVNQSALDDAKDFILGAGDDLTEVAEGDTNYEAGFHAAYQWFNDPGNTLNDPDINKTLFVSDGLPNRYYGGNGTNVSGIRSAQDSIAHVLGNYTHPNRDDDTFSELAALQGSFKGVNGTVDAIGIDVDSDALDRLSEVDGGLADNITSAEELADALSNLSAATELDQVGDDVIVGNAGADVIFGDVLFTDLLADDESLSLSPGSGWLVIDQLAADGFFGAEPSQTGIMAFLRDPDNWSDYQLWRESQTSSGEGREGGNDSIDAGSGADIVFGQEGSDTILGGAGEDLIVGGTGDDSLTGGADSDVFLWTDQFNAGETDTVTDFTPGEGDVLDLSALLQGVAPTDTGTELDAYLDFSFDGTDTTITVDVAGDGGGADLTIVCQGVDLTGAGSDAAIIDSLIASNNLEAGTA